MNFNFNEILLIVPTFISLLRDIESAYDVREICRDYLGDGPTTNQFANQFLEKRRLFRPKTATQKDDMCAPAPAITPSNQHSSEFQEVKVTIMYYCTVVASIVLFQI